MWSWLYLSSLRFEYTCCMLMHSNSLCHHTLTMRKVSFWKKSKIASLFLQQHKVYSCNKSLLYLSLHLNQSVPISVLLNICINQNATAFICSQCYRHKVDKHSIHSRLNNTDSFLPFSLFPEKRIKSWFLY